MGNNSSNSQHTQQQTSSSDSSSWSIAPQFERRRKRISASKLQENKLKRMTISAFNSTSSCNDSNESISSFRLNKEKRKSKSFGPTSKKPMTISPLNLQNLQKESNYENSPRSFVLGRQLDNWGDGTCSPSSVNDNLDSVIGNLAHCVDKHLSLAIHGQDLDYLRSQIDIVDKINNNTSNSLEDNRSIKERTKTPETNSSYYGDEESFFVEDSLSSGTIQSSIQYLKEKLSLELSEREREKQVEEIQAPSTLSTITSATNSTNNNNNEEKKVLRRIPSLLMKTKRKSLTVQSYTAANTEGKLREETIENNNEIIEENSKKKKDTTTVEVVTPRTPRTPRSSRHSRTKSKG
ncbi:hypothetical protein ABK040_014060 [Willaertia magna]